MTNFNEILEECKAIHDKKEHDYAKMEDPFSNFRFAARLAEEFTNPIDKVFATIIGIKEARLIELRNGKEPKNESVRDNHLDLINYCILWLDYWDREKDEAPMERVNFALDSSKTYTFLEPGRVVWQHKDGCLALIWGDPTRCNCQPSPCG